MGVGAAAQDNAFGGALRPVVPENSEPKHATRCKGGGLRSE